MMLKEALRMIEKPGSMFKGEILTKKVVDWLRFLKDRLHLQPKQEWNGEDERMINSIIKNIDEGEWFDIYQTNWLKSLKERFNVNNEKGK